MHSSRCGSKQISQSLEDFGTLRKAGVTHSLSRKTDAAVTSRKACWVSRYVTEGMLRALHRRTAPCPAHYKTWWPWCTFAKSDAVILPRGTPIEITFALLPVGWVFKAGSRMRLAVAGGDRDHIAQVPHGRPPRLRIHHGIAHPSRLLLPVRSGV